MSAQPLLRVRSIHVDKLFGLFDHGVELKLAERVTILHGPNGVGKTMLLRMVSDLLAGHYALFLQVPFERFVLEFDDDSRVELTVGENGNDTGGSPLKPLRLVLFRDGKETGAHEISATADVLLRAVAIERNFPWISRVSEDAWIDQERNRLMTADELIELYGGTLPGRRSRNDNTGADPKWLKDFRESTVVHLIAAQRLLKLNPAYSTMSRGKPQNIHMVLDYADDLRTRINDTMARYGQQSQVLDQSFPQRLLSSPQEPMSADELKTRMDDLDVKRDELKKIGLLDKPEARPFDTAALESLDTTRQSVMSLYVQDTSEKLAVLSDLALRTRLFLDNVNCNKFLNKRIRIDREAGLIAERDDGTLLKLEALSSGEQHELVMHYDLLFRVKPNTLVLIDEPELSLHVAWQKRFLPDLLKIVETAHFDALIATHSPFIVGDRSDLMIGLNAELV